MRNLFYLFLLFIILLSSCDNDKQKTTYEWKIKVEYQNADFDTLLIRHTIPSRFNPVIYLKTSESHGLFSSAEVPSCLTIGYGFHNHHIACYVRVYEILEEKIIWNETQPSNK